MPLFFFDFMEATGPSADVDGTECHDLAHAQVEAARTLVELARSTAPPYHAAIHIRDESRSNILCRVSLDLAIWATA